MNLFYTQEKSEKQSLDASYPITFQKNFLCWL